MLIGERKRTEHLRQIRGMGFVNDLAKMGVRVPSQQPPNAVFQYFASVTLHMSVSFENAYSFLSSGII
jgi:hypothetical protein